jgi:formate-dependent nitrite reductase membrane component NrfD
MNLFVADPHWGWWIVFYFFLGGVAAGAYFMATLIDLMGHESDRELARLGYWVAFPLICLCGLLLTVDLERPERFWHMLFKSEVVKDAVEEGWPWHGGWERMTHAPLLKYWSPMSMGSWALLLFGFCSLLSFFGSLWTSGFWYRWLRVSVFGRMLQCAGSLVGFFVAAYTGSLLTATNQPVWSDSVWIAPLFLSSAASTGIATMIVLARYRGAASSEAIHRLENADLWVLGLELVVLAAFLASLGPLLGPVLGIWPGKLLVVGTLLGGVLLPLALHLRLGISSLRSAVVAAALVLAGGFLMRVTILNIAPDLLSHGPAGIIEFGPEEGRVRGGGPGADPGNKSAVMRPRSKIFPSEAP